MRAIVVVLASAFGCRMGFDERVDIASDASGDAGSTADAGSADGASVDGPVFSCDAAYTAWDASPSRYRYVTTMMAWLAAESACEAEGAHLVVVDNAQEQAAVVANVASPRVWIGLSDRVIEGTYLAVAGPTPAYDAWPGSPPSNRGEDCAEILGGGAWEDADCIEVFASVCECDGQPVVVGNF